MNNGNYWLFVIQSALFGAIFTLTLLTRESQVRFRDMEERLNTLEQAAAREQPSHSAAHDCTYCATPKKRQAPPERLSMQFLYQPGSTNAAVSGGPPPYQVAYSVRSAVFLHCTSAPALGDQLRGQWPVIRPTDTLGQYSHVVLTPISTLHPFISRSFQL